MDRFEELLPNGNVLETGAGGVRDVKELIAKGYDYTGIDVSQALLKVAKKVNPKATFLQKSVYDLDFPEDTFDGFWASAVLLHVPRDRIDEVLSNLHRVVRNGGIGFISIKQGKGQKFEEYEPQKLPRLFVYWQDRKFQKVLKRNNFELIEKRVIPMSERTTWLVYFVRNKKDSRNGSVSKK